MKYFFYLFYPLHIFLLLMLLVALYRRTVSASLPRQLLKAGALQDAISIAPISRASPPMRRA